MKLSSAYVTDPGPTRARNEDACLVLDSPTCFLLSDGMGGGPDGKLASQIICAVAAEQLKRGAALDASVLGAHNALRMDCTRRTGDTQAGATLVALLIQGNRYDLAWVGDSRIYRFNDALLQLTADHSIVEGLLASGAISLDEASNHPYANSLTQVLGKTAPDALEIETMSGRIHSGDRFLLCSDGLHGKLGQSEITDILEKRLAAAETARLLVSEALKRDADDNVSAMVVDVIGNTGQAV